MEYLGTAYISRLGHTEDGESGNNFIQGYHGQRGRSM